MKRLITYFSTPNALSLVIGSTLDRLWSDIDPLKSRKFLSILALLLTLGVGNAWGALSSPYECTFTSGMSMSGSNCTTGDVTWTVSTTTGKGSPSITFGNQNTQSCIKFGSGKSNYYSKMTLTTSAFSAYNVSSVVIYASSNNGGTKTFKVTQGATQIGTGSQSFSTTTWVTNITRNTTSGSGGDLSIEISSDATATYVHSIKVTYSAPSCTVTPTVGSSLTSVSATVSSITATVPISAIGGCNITENGLVYSTTNSTPTVGGTNCTKVTTTACGSTAANKTVTISDLTCGQSYYVRGYATNAAGTSYTNVTTQSTSACPLYTVTLMDDSDTRTQASYGASVTLPSRAGCSGYTFSGWSTTNNTVWTTTAPTIISAGSYTPTANINLYPVYTKTESGSGFSSYTKVTSAPSDWSGKYLISDGTSTATGEKFSSSALEITTLTPGTTEYTSYEFTITKNGDNNNYFIITPDGENYVGYASSANLKFSTSTPVTNDYLWTCQTSDPMTLNVATTTRYIGVGTESATDVFKAYSTAGTNAKCYLYKRIEGGSTTYYISVPNCCTPLGSINESVKGSTISGTGLTLQWDDISNVSSWAVTGYDNTASAAVAAVNIATPTDEGSTYECVISNLTAGHEYTFTIAATAASGYCDKTQDVTVTTPLITLSETGLSGMSYIEGYGPSTQTKTFTVTAVGLTGNLTVEAPTNFQVSTDNSSWGSSKTISHSSGSASGTVYVRLASGLDAGSYGSASTYVTVSGGSATTKNVSVQGTVSPACADPTINTQPAASASYNMNVTATALSVSATKNGTGPALTYQWYSNTANSKTTPEPSPIDGATSSSYTPPTTATGTKYYFCEVSSGACAVTTNISAITVSTPTITVSETSRAFGDRAKDGSYEMTFTVSGSTLAKDAGISLAISGTNASLFSIDKTSLSPTSNAVGTTTITVTYSPNVTGSHSAQIDITSTGATTKTVTLSGTSKNAATVKLHVAGSTSTISGTRYEGDSYSLPSTATECPDMGLYGWYIGEDYEHATTAPTGDSFKLPGASATLEAGDNDFYAVYATVTPDAANTYTKITSTDDLVTGDYLIVGQISSYYAMKNAYYSSESTMADESRTVTDNQITNSASDKPEFIWHFTKSNSTITIYSANSSKYFGFSSNHVALMNSSQALTCEVSEGKWAIYSGSDYLKYSSYFQRGDSKVYQTYLFKRDPSIAGPYTTSPSCTTHSLSTAVTPVSTGTAVAGKTVIGEGKTTTVTATPESGYAFRYWTISGEGSTMSNTSDGKSTDNPVTVTMGTADATITAHFAERVAITFNVPTGVTKPDNSYTDVALPTPSGFPSAVDGDCWEFAGWTESSSVNSTSAPATLYPADTRYNGEATSAFNLYAVYKRVVFEQVYDADDLEADADYVISKYSDPNEYAIKAEVSNTTKAAGTNIIDISQEIEAGDGYHYFIHNPASYNIWRLTGSTNSWQLTNGDLHVNLSNSANPVLQGSGANMKIAEGTESNASLFSFQDATTATNYLGYSSTEFLIDDEETFFYVYKFYSSLYMTTPAEPTYTITWKVSGEDDDVQTITHCAGLTDSDLPTPPADNTLSSCVTNSTFVGWTETPLANATDEEPADLFMRAGDAPMIRGDKTFYAVFANGSNVESDVINNSATSSNLGSTGTSNWATDFTLTGSTGAQYYIHSMGTKNGTHALQWNSNGYLYCKTAPTSGLNLLRVTAEGTDGKTIAVFGSNTAYSAKATDSSPSAKLANLTMDGTYNFSDTYQYIGINGTEGSTQINTLTITYGSYSGYRTSCCETPTFTISGTGKTVTDGKISFPVLREDLGGASTSTWAELPITISSNSSGTITIIEGTGGDAGKTAWKLSSWESRAETGGTIAATGHATFTSPSAGNYLFKVKTTTGQTGQGTYRIGIHQAADATYCEATYYLWVDVTMRDKFVDNVNGNATINVDTHGATTTTPTEASLDADKNDDCHETTRRLVGWVKETDMESWYGAGQDRTRDLDDKTANITAPGATITTSGATWYAVWGIEE